MIQQNRLLFLGLLCTFGLNALGFQQCVKSVYANQLLSTVHKAQTFMHCNPKKIAAGVGIGITALAVAYWRNRNPVHAVPQVNYHFAETAKGIKSKKSDKVESLTHLEEIPQLGIVYDKKFFNDVESEFQKRWIDSRPNNVAFKNFSISIGGVVWLTYQPAPTKTAHYHFLTHYNLEKSVDATKLYEILYSFTSESESKFIHALTESTVGEFIPEESDPKSERKETYAIKVVMRGEDVKQQLADFIELLEKKAHEHELLVKDPGANNGEKGSRLNLINLETNVYVVNQTEVSIVLVPKSIFSTSLDANRGLLFPGVPDKIDATICIGKKGKTKDDFYRVGKVRQKSPIALPLSLIVPISAKNASNLSEDKKNQEEAEILQKLPENAQYTLQQEIVLQNQEDLGVHLGMVLQKSVKCYDVSPSWNLETKIVEKESLSKDQVLACINESALAVQDASDNAVQALTKAKKCSIKTRQTGGMARVNIGNTFFTIQLLPQNKQISIFGLFGIPKAEFTPQNFANEFNKNPVVSTRFIISSPSLRSPLRIERPLRFKTIS